MLNSIVASLVSGRKLVSPNRSTSHACTRTITPECLLAAPGLEVGACARHPCKCWLSYAA